MAPLAVAPFLADPFSFDDFLPASPGLRPYSALYSLPPEIELIISESAMEQPVSEAAASVCETSHPAKKPQNYPQFVCEHPGCGRAFAKKWNLQAHARLHTGEKPFACRHGCGERLMWMSSLKSHERRKCRLLPAAARVQKRKRLRPAAVKRAPSPSLSIGSSSTASEMPIVNNFPLPGIDGGGTPKGNKAFPAAVDFSRPVASSSTVSEMPDPSDFPLPGIDDTRTVTGKQDATIAGDLSRSVPPDEDIVLELEGILSSFF